MPHTLHRGLGARVYGVTVVTLLAAVGTQAVVQARAADQLHRAQVLEGAKATLAVAADALAVQLLVADFAGLDQALLLAARHPGMLRLQVCEGDGQVLGDVVAGPGGPSLVASPDPARIALPASVAEEQQFDEATGRLVVWHPLGTRSQVIGWARAVVDLRPLQADLRLAWQRALLVAAGSVVASLLLFLWILRGPLATIRRLADFARQLAQHKGERLPPGHASWEVEQLREALNYASVELQASEQRILEEEQAKRAVAGQLLQAQKMEALGLLAGGVAHDFNNLLTGISGYANLAAERAESRAMQEDLEQILAATERAAGLTRSLLMFSRQQKPQIAHVDLNGVVAGMVKLLRRVVGEDIEVRVVAAAAPVWVLADRGQLDQVLLNLAANARDAMPGGGVLTFETGRVDAPAPTGWPGGAAPPAAACVSVTDTGCGMDEAMVSRIFEPFFTTKALGRGTGLGLSIVHGIVSGHHGTVEVRSQVGAGTTFRILLPLADRPAAADAAAAPAAAEPPGHGTVLVVEDDPMVNRVLCLTLESAGYKVLSAANGRLALELLRATQEPVDLLLSDVIMPEMNGVELLDEARRGRPGLPAILMSGYTADALERRGPLPGDVRILPKPVSPQVVRAEVRRVLQARP